MKKLSKLNLGKGLSREEMKVVKGGGIPGVCTMCKNHFYDWYCDMVYSC
jgi:hypothetical protein